METSRLHRTSRQRRSRFGSSLFKDVFFIRLASMNSRSQCMKTFSLRAFQNLITRRAYQATRYLSCETFSYTVHRPCAFSNTSSLSSNTFRDTDDNYTRSSIDLDYVNVDTFLDDVRSVSAESDCSDDDTRDDEGLIPIYWDYQLPSIQVSKHERKGSLHSNVSCSSKYSVSLFSEVFSPSLTPASSVYSGSVVGKRSGSFGERAIEETVRWLLES